jgi:hypothetical protein
MNRNRWIVLGGGVAVVLLVAFAVFRPDKLFADQEVDEQLDADVAAALDATTTTTGPVEPAPDDPAAVPTTAQPAPAEPAQPVVTARGDFVSQNSYTVSGAAVVVTQPDGQRLLVLQDLESDNGPDLQLYVSPSADGAVEGGIKLAPLMGNIGTQSYELPADVDLSALSNVVIWCERFSSAFGTATLS